MKINITSSLFLFFLIFFCAANAKTEIVKGEKFAGEEITYAYQLEKKADQYVLVRQPICMEMQEEIEVSKGKKKRALETGKILAAPTVIITPQLGSFVLQRFDMAASAAGGDIKKHHGNVQTNRIILCGEQEPGANEKLIIQTSHMKIFKDMVTDSNGVIDLKSIAQKAGDEIYCNIFVKTENSLFYLSTIYFKQCCS